MSPNVNFDIDLPDESATRALGAKLATIVKAGDVVVLQGDLGAGKTTLVRGLVQAAGGDEAVPSPTFTLVQSYELESFYVWHFDLYRLERPQDIWELGLEEALDEGVSLIEWPERAGDLLPEDRLTIHLSHKGQGRSAHIDGSSNWANRIEQIKE